MKWWDKFVAWGYNTEAEVEDAVAKPKVVDMMKDDIDPAELTVENAYKTRWIWYHTILAIGIFFTNALLLAILLLLAVKL